MGLNKGPEKEGEVKVVMPEGAGERGTINPDSGRPATITFKGSDRGTYHLRIFTLTGEIVYEKEQNFPGSAGSFEWIPKGIASGIYLAHIKGPGIDKFRKIAVLR